MKKFLMTAVLGMFALAGFSQVKWDARVGMNFSNMTKAEGTKALPGFNLGVGMDYGFSENWSLQSGLKVIKLRIIQKIDLFIWIFLFWLLTNSISAIIQNLLSMQVRIWHLD